MSMRPPRPRSAPPPPPPRPSPPSWPPPPPRSAPAMQTSPRASNFPNLPPARHPQPPARCPIHAVSPHGWDSETCAAPAARTQPNSIAFGRRADADLKQVTITPKSIRGYKLPPSSLLYRSDEVPVVREEALRAEARTLVQKCAEFGVNGQVTQINPGPIVTTFEFHPDAGVKYSRVTGLADDLCLAMAAESILIERMAGKSTVGIQVPNHGRETIWLRDVVECESFAQSKSKLAIALGKDINGRIVTADLAAMPHILIAGSTGSGKSVAINAMIMSVLFKSTPEQVPHDPGRSQARRAGHVRGHPPPLHPHHHRHQAGRQRPAQRRARDGAPPQAARRQPRPQHRPVQQALRQQLRLPLRRRRPGAAALHHHHHRRARRPDDARPRQRRRVHHPPRADGPRRRHPSRAGHAAPIGRCHHRPHQGQHPHPHQLPASPPRSIRAPSSTPTAPNPSSARATCSTFPPAPAACSASTRRL